MQIGRAFTVLLPALALGLWSAWLPTGVRSGEEPPSDVKASLVYRIQYLQPLDGMMLAHQACLSLLGKRTCEFQPQGADWFVYTTDAAGHKAIAEVLRANDVPPPTQVFRITLLRASASTSPSPSLPQAETRALEGLRQMLPYKGYEIVDAGWVRTSWRGKLMLGGGASYRVDLQLKRSNSPARRSLDVEEFELWRDPGTSAEQRLLSTSFWVEVGETVVVGTSKLDGGSEAMVVLLTAGD